jgi:hypothetical protein
VTNWLLNTIEYLISHYLSVFLCIVIGTCATKFATYWHIDKMETMGLLVLAYKHLYVALFESL